jgi:GNAT superfamily N-acetyltransferase
MNITTRAFVESDRAALEEILFAVSGSHAGQSNYDIVNPGTDGDEFPIWRSFVAELNGRIVGFGGIGENDFNPTSAYLGINIHPDFWRRGIGSQLFETLTAELERIRGPQAIRAVTSEANATAIAFLEGHRFTEDNRTFRQVLEFQKFDPSIFNAHLERLARIGIEIHSLSTLSADLKSKAKAAAVYRAVYTAAHIANPAAESSLEDWICELNLFQPDGVMIAVQNGAYIGIGALSESPMFEGAMGFLYGTLESHSDLRLDVSLAIVLHQVRYLEARGIHQLTLEIDSDDVNGMALRSALPVTPQPGFVTMLRPTR